MVKTRWCDEEIYRMASIEVKLTTVNSGLAVPNLTIEAIKGKWRTPAYKALVAKLVAERPEGPVQPDGAVRSLPEIIPFDGNKTPLIKKFV